MKKSLHPGAIAAILASFVVAVGMLFVKLGGRETAKSYFASPYTKVGERPTSPGAGVNSLTGEPLPQTAKDYEAASFAQHAGR